jgi:hypothetical protein
MTTAETCSEPHVRPRKSVATTARRRYLCGIRTSISGSFTYGVGGWPFGRVTIDDSWVSVGPALGPLLVLMSLGLALAVMLERWPAALLIPAGLAALAITPRRRYALSAVRACEVRVNAGSRAVELSTDAGTDRIWLWCLPVDSLLSEMARRGAPIEPEAQAKL